MTKIKISNFIKLHLNDGHFNCKFVSFGNVQACLRRDEKKTVEAIKQYAKFYVSWFVTVNNMKWIDILTKHFTPIYIQKVPIGYSGRYQYHCLFRGGKKGYKNRLDKEPCDTSTLITDKNLNKILNYKSKTWLKKFLQKYI